MVGWCRSLSCVGWEIRRQSTIRTSICLSVEREELRTRFRVDPLQPSSCPPLVCLYQCQYYTSFIYYYRSMYYVAGNDFSLWSQAHMYWWAEPTFTAGRLDYAKTTGFQSNLVGGHWREHYILVRIQFLNQGNSWAMVELWTLLIAIPVFVVELQENNGKASEPTITCIWKSLQWSLQYRENLNHNVIQSCFWL